MKPATRNVLVALVFFGAFVIAYRWIEPRNKPVVTTQQARRLPAIAPPQRNVEEDEESRLRKEHAQRLADIAEQEMRDRLAGRQIMPGEASLTPGAGTFEYPPIRPEPVPPDPARPVQPLETR